MSTAYVADVHVGNFKRHGGETVASVNARCQMVLDTLHMAIEHAQQRECTRFVVCGDLLDYSRPEAPVLSKVQQLFRNASRQATRPMDIVLLLGNHEQISTTAGDHALGVLSTYAVVVEKPTVLGDLLCVPFMPGPAKDWLGEAVRGMLGNEGGGASAHPPGRPHRTLALHLGIRDGCTPVWLKNAPDAIDIDLLFDICDEHGIDRVVAGNWHNHQTWKRGGVRVMQLGALCPTGWDNPGREGYGTVAVQHAGVLKRHEVPGPRFIKAGSLKEAKDEAAKARADRCQPFVSVTVLPEALADTTDWLDAARKKNLIAGGEAVVDDTLVQHEASNAAAAARGADNVDAALVDYVEHKPMPDTVDRAAVLRRCQEYMK